MPTANSALRLGRRHQSSRQQCYSHHFHTINCTISNALYIKYVETTQNSYLQQKPFPAKTRTIHDALYKSPHHHHPHHPCYNAKRSSTSLSATESATQQKVMSHEWTTSAALIPFLAPCTMKSRHYNNMNSHTLTHPVSVIAGNCHIWTYNYLIVICPYGGWCRWALVSPDGVVPSRWSVCLPLPCTTKSRSSLLALAHPGGPGKRAVKRLWFLKILRVNVFLCHQLAKGVLLCCLH